MKEPLKRFVFIFVSVMLSAGICMYLLNSIHEDIVYKNYRSLLKNEVRFIEKIINTDVKTGNFNNLALRTHLFVMVIDKKGKVLYSLRTYPSSVSILASKDLKDALYYGNGFAVEYDPALSRRMIYYAEMCSGGYIIRVGYPISLVRGLSLFSEQGAILVMLFFVITIASMSAYMARSMYLPIQKLNYIVDAINSNRIHVHFPRFKNPTMSKIGGLIYRIYHAMLSKQRELVEETEKLHTIIQSASDGIILLDRNNTVLLSNPVFSEITGVSIKDGENILSSAGDIESIQLLNKLTTFEEGWHKVDLGNMVLGVLVRRIGDNKFIVLKDMTDRRRYEEFKTRLTDSISHELKTPIATLMGYAETLMSHDVDDSTKRNFIERIYSTTKRLDELISDIVELNRLEFQEGGFKVEEPTSLKDIEAEVREHLKGKTDKRVKFDVEDKSVYVLPEHLVSILSNLISNGIKYSKGQNIYVSVKTRDERVIVDVDDEGPVIPDEEKERIFERFYTRSASRSRDRSGTGLGLSIVKHISHLYSGQIILLKNEYGGNRFEVVLRERY